MTSPELVRDAAATLFDAWMAGRQIAALPESLRPATEAEGFAIQQAIVARSGARRFGWKIAATSTAGQKHIGVAGPLVGSILESRVVGPDDPIDLRTNIMKVIEAEFAFRFARPLLPRAEPYTVAEVLDAVASLHPAIEIPDSRYADFVTAGAPQLMADNACASWFTLGPATTADWRSIDLVAHAVTARVDGRVAGEGTGANVLGDPRVALAWIVNRLSGLGVAMGAGEVVTTGTCVVPVTVTPGASVSVDFGVIGQHRARFAA